jgi:hypothetical protein
MLRALPALGLVLGCASAGQSDAPDANRTTDGRTVDTLGTIDAVMTRTLTQTASMQLEPLASASCNASPGTAATNYYRVFDLAAFDIQSDFTVTGVSFQVEHCERFADNNSTNVTVRVGTYSGTVGETLTLADMVVLTSNSNVAVPEVIEDPGPPATTPGGTVTAPLTATIPGGTKFFIEINAPDGDNIGSLYLGANDDGESGFGYVLAPTCSIPVPTNISATVGSPVHLLMTVSGTY